MHVISHEPTDTEATLCLRAGPDSPGARRFRGDGKSIGWVLAAIGLPLLTLALVQVRDDIGLETVLLLFLLLVVVVGAIGGIVPGVVAAVAGFLLANWFFTPPFHTWTISEGENVLALVVFVVVSAVVSALVDLAARRALDAHRARAEAETLARLAADVGTDDPLRAIVASMRERVPPRCRRARVHGTVTAGGSKRPTAIRSPRHRTRPTRSRTSATARPWLWSGRG